MMRRRRRGRDLMSNSHLWLCTFLTNSLSIEIAISASASDRCSFLPSFLLAIVAIGGGVSWWCMGPLKAEPMGRGEYPPAPLNMSESRRREDVGRGGGGWGGE